MSWVNKKLEGYRKGEQATLIEKGILAHADPINMLLFVIGLLLIGYGLWQHDWNVVLGGAAVGILGDVISWFR